MTDLHKAEAAAREAESARQAAYKSGDKAEIAAAHARCANTQDNLLAALDAARGEAVAWGRRWFIEGEAPYKVRDERTKRMRLANKFTFKEATPTKLFADDVPLFAAPPAALAEPAWTEDRLREEAKKRGWKMMQWHEPTPDGPWRYPFIVSIPSAELCAMLAAQAQQPAAAVPELNYADAQKIAAEYGLPYNAFCAAHRAMLAAAERKGGGQ